MGLSGPATLRQSAVIMKRKAWITRAACPFKFSTGILSRLDFQICKGRHYRTKTDAADTHTHTHTHTQIINTWPTKDRTWVCT